MPDMLQAQSALGLVALLLLAWSLGEERRLSAWRIAVTGAALQIVLAALMLYLPGLGAAVAAANRVVVALGAATEAGTSLVFGYLGGAPLPFEESFPGAAFVLAFRALPVILVVSALAALLAHWRILPLVVQGLRPASGARLSRRRTGGARERGQRPRRDDRGPASGAPLPGPPLPIGTLRADDHRHGDDRRHGLRALLADPDPGAAGRRLPAPGRLGDQRTGGGERGPVDGPAAGGAHRGAGPAPSREHRRHRRARARRPSGE